MKNNCSACDGSGEVDSGGFREDGKPINVPCTECVMMKYRVIKHAHSLDEIWRGDTCVSDRVFNGCASEVASKLNAHDDLIAACKALREAALNLRGEVIVTGELTAKTLEPMFAADDLAQAAIAKATKGTT